MRERCAHRKRVQWRREKADGEGGEEEEECAIDVSQVHLNRKNRRTKVDGNGREGCSEILTQCFLRGYQMKK